MYVAGDAIPIVDLFYISENQKKIKQEVEFFWI